MLMTMHVPCNDYPKHYFMTGKRSKAFNGKDGKGNICLERSDLSIPPLRVLLLSKFVGCSRSKIRKLKTLSRETPVTNTKQKLKLYYLLRAASKFCNNEQKDNSTTSNEWILEVMKRISQWVIPKFCF